MSINRRDFLGSFGVVTPLLLEESRRVAEAAARPLNQAWDTSWADRVKGKYRGIFDSPGFSDGAALFRAVVWKRDYKEIFGTAATEMTAVLVVRHQGIWLAMN